MKVLAGVRQQLLTAGVPASGIPEEWLPAIIAATAKWMETTEDGLEYGARLFNFEFERGRDDCDYELTYYEKCERRDFCMSPDHCMPEGYGPPVRCLRELQPIVKPLKSRDVYFFQGCIADRRSVGLTALGVYEKDKEQCGSEGCGITAHCVRKVSGAYSKTIIYQCNHCLSYSDDSRLRGEADPSQCDDCTVIKCTHHPRRDLSGI
jgi:hypothetical protein